jgi:hypothetical protein
MIFGVLGAFLGIEISLSLAGRETALLQHLPFMSLQAASSVVLAVSVGAVYILWSLARARNWKRLGLFASAVTLIAMGCGLLFWFSSGKSTNEARHILGDFLVSPRKYRVSYSRETNEGLLSTFRGPETRTDAVYASHAYGRYVYRLSRQGDELIIQLNKDLDDTNIFVYRPSEYAAPAS